MGRCREEHQRVQRERAELVASLDRLAPAWRELRAVLNDPCRILEEHRDKKFNEFVDELKKTAKIEDTDPPDENGGCGSEH